MAAALDVRLGYLLGAPDTTTASVGATVLLGLPQGPTTHAAAIRTLSGFLTEHASRAAALAPGVVLDATREATLAADAVVLAHLAQAADDVALASLRLASPVTSGLDDERLWAVVDPRVVSDVVRLTRAAQTSLWRPLATADVERVGVGAWRLGDQVVVVDLGEGRLARVPVRPDACDRSATWVGRYERLVRHRDHAASARRGAEEPARGR